MPSGRSPVGDLVFEAFEENLLTGMSQESAYHELPPAGDGMGGGGRRPRTAGPKQKTIDQIEVSGQGPSNLEEHRHSGLLSRQATSSGPKGPTEAQLEEVARLRERGNSPPT